MTWLLILGGLALLAAGGEAVVRGAVGAARRLGVSELLIGLTLVGFGTSTPELLTSVNAALRGADGVAVGNVVGSNISNVLLIFAISALIRPAPVDKRALARDGLVMVAAVAALSAYALWQGALGQVAGWVMLAALAAYMAYAFFSERQGAVPAAAEFHEAEAKAHEPAPPKLLLSLGLALVGMAALILGADWLVRGAIDLARMAGMSETVIGLTIVAVGTSLPELVATLAAAMRGRAEVAFGNIVGSNIYNVLGILGVTAAIRPIAIPPDLTLVDWAVFVLSALVLTFFAWTKGKVSRVEGGIMLAGYIAYVVYLIARVGAA